MRAHTQARCNVCSNAPMEMGFVTYHHIIFVVINLFLRTHEPAADPVQHAVQTITGTRNIYDACEPLHSGVSIIMVVDRYPYGQFSCVNVHGWESKLFGTM